ncbi:LMBR1 domain-containing protein 2-like [Porphyridium purpureum]|uniref:LMBR1 domain-containing protein 2-like n=1 Tax=Porphyridium purpureum TaxID=35688 RepID=A0A5J4YQD9_PORPP|nr:LMBR1 domain-containing protein 2-like [Porphyridium purpureum]|eukprot:POR8309..scf295_9
MGAGVVWVSAGFAVEVILICVISAYAVRYYATRSTTLSSRSALVLVWTCWVMSMMVVALLPADLSNTLALRAGQFDAASDKLLAQSVRVSIGRAYAIIYWVSYAFSWVVIPVVTAYSVSGAFSAMSRFQSALRANLRIWVLSGVLLLGFLVYAGTAYGFNFDTLRGILISFGNSFGLLVVMIALGSGLVGFPAALFGYANHERRLRYCEYAAGEIAERLENARAEVAAAMGQVITLRQLIVAGKIRSSKPSVSVERLSECLSVVERESPASGSSSDDEIVVFPQPFSDSEQSADTSAFNAPERTLSEDELAELRGDLSRKVIEFRKVSYLWRERCREYFELEELMQWKQYSALETGTVVASSASPLSSSSTAPTSNVRKYLNAYVLPSLARLVGTLTVFLSVLVVLSEGTLWSIRVLGMDLSVFSRLLHSRTLQGALGSTGIQTLSYAIVGYFSACFLFAVFRFSFFHMYELVPCHTEVYTLLLNATMLVRYTFPLTYNVLTVLHETALDARLLGGGDKALITSFSDVLKNLELVPLFGVGFNMYFPSVLAVFVLLSFFDVWNLVLAMCGMKRFGFESKGNESLEATGRHLLAFERNREARRMSPRSQIGRASSVGARSSAFGARLPSPV